MTIRSSLSKVLVAVALLSAVGCGGSVATLEYVGIEPPQPRIGEVATVTFKVTDYRGQAMAGTEISFHLQSNNGGATLTPLTGTSQKGTGTVGTQLIATSHVSSVIVVATAGDKSVSSPSISFAGAAANGRQFTFQCGSISGTASGGLHALGAYDTDRYLIAGVKADCIAHVGDRNGDGVPGALVSFLTEAGTIGPTETSLADVLGNAMILYKTSYPLPQPTEPGTFSWTPLNDPTHTGDYLAPLWMEPFRWTNNPILNFGVTPNLQEPRRKDPVLKGLNLTNNPRDNLVAMIAVTSGEEGFTDSNNNGTYDQGEVWDDLTEPFVDSNDDGTWNEGEKYVDTDNNGHWDGKNGVWDKNTLLWVQERLLWTGIPNNLDTQGAEPILRIVSPVGPIFVPFLSYYGMDDPAFPGNRIPLPAIFLLSDPWFNSIAQNGNGDGCEIGTTDDKLPVTAVPKMANQGFKYDYPSYELISFGIHDARDPLAVPQVALRVPPIDFGVPLNCTYTGSQIDGASFRIEIGTIRGKVE